MVKISFLGSCREVGRSGILLESNNGDKCILDYGVRFRGKERLPKPLDTSNLKAVTSTHCHVDHSGAIPYFYQDKMHHIPYITNPVSLEISHILLKDMLRISSYYYPFGYKEINKMRQKAFFLENHRRLRISDNIHLTFFDAGHIPGSVSILAEIDDKKIFYTGDINTQKTNLINQASAKNVPPIDCLITESTYTLKDHESREKLEQEFVEKIFEITDSGGKVLVPAFGVARSQEVLLILQKYGYSGKIFIDGLAKRVCNIYKHHGDSLKDHSFYKKSLKRAHFISKRKRNVAKRSNGVIIAPSGMLKGGVAIDFIKSFVNDPQSAIYLVGYQVEGSPGRVLLDTGIFEYEDEYQGRKESYSIDAQCDTKYFDFSSHADGTHLHKYIDNIKFNNGAKAVFCVHGDEKATTTLSSELAKKDYNSVAPEIGESYVI